MKASDSLLSSKELLAVLKGRILAVPGARFRIFCFLTRQSETGLLGGSHSKAFSILVEMQLEAAKLQFLLLS